MQEYKKMMCAICSCLRYIIPVENSTAEPSVWKALYTQQFPYEIDFYIIFYFFPFFFFALFGKLANLSTGMFWHLSIIYDNMSGGKTAFANKREQNRKDYFWEVLAEEAMCSDEDKAILIFNI